jgi:hypothetical protein
MMWIKNFSLFKESLNYKNENLVRDLCVGMLLINNNFLDNILDKGQKTRYTSNSNVFINDLKTLLHGNNRLNFGKFENNRWVIDSEISKINDEFNSSEFDIEKDWNMLLNARTIARNIIDKILLDEKLNESMIKYIFWIGVNKTKELGEDLVIETHDGKQYSLFLNKNVTTKSTSFNTFTENILGEEQLDNLFGEEYLKKWDKLTQEFCRLTYEHGTQQTRLDIEKFIEPDRIYSITYFDYFKIKHMNPKFANLGEFFSQYNKNILDFSDLIQEIYKNKEVCIKDNDVFMKEWLDIKNILLNSKILEYLFQTGFTKLNEGSEPDKKLENGYRQASDNGKIKMRLMKNIVESIGSLDREAYYLANNGNVFVYVPSREFFRKYYDNFKIKYYYHVVLSDVIFTEDNSDFKIMVELDLDDKLLLKNEIVIKWSGGELSSRMTAKQKYGLIPDFNVILIDKNKNIDQQDIA